MFGPLFLRLDAYLITVVLLVYDFNNGYSSLKEVHGIPWGCGSLRHVKVEAPRLS